MKYIALNQIKTDITISEAFFFSVKCDKFCFMAEKKNS